MMKRAKGWKRSLLKGLRRVDWSLFMCILFFLVAIAAVFFAPDVPTPAEQQMANAAAVQEQMKHDKPAAGADCSWHH